MTAMEIIFSIAGAFLVGTLFYYLFNVSGPWGSYWTFILVLILATIAVTAWVTPFGPIFREVSWLAILLIVIFFALLLSAATPPGGRTPVRRQTEIPPEEEPATGAVAAMGIFFFTLILFLIAASVAGILID